MRYVEYCTQPFQRNGTMVPVSSLKDFYALEDSGYCTHYQYSAHAANAIRAQGNSEKMARFPVYSDRLWIDLDAPSSDPAEVAKVKTYAGQLTNQFKQQGLDFTVWFSGSKGYHICIKITPMEGMDVPYSQAQYVQHILKVSCDFSLYQSARLLSNPGRKHPKTGLKKVKVFEHKGNTLLTIPMIANPKPPISTLESLTDSDRARIAFQRLSGLILDAPLPGMRHTSLWSVATQCMEAGMAKDLVSGTLLYANQFFADPKTKEEVLRAIEQAESQLR